jgi:hypothetical protein
MIRSELENLCASLEFTRNASKTLGPYWLQKSGPNTVYYFDVNATGSGRLSIQARIGNTASDVFYRPRNASKVCASHTPGTRSRYVMSHKGLSGGPWVKLRLFEMNASHMTLSLDMVTVME